MPDNSGFFYEKLGDVKNPYSGQIRFHRLGTNPTGDPLLFRQYTKEENEKLATTWGPGANVSRDGRWMVLSYWTGTSSNDVWVIDLRKWWSGGDVGKGVPGGGTFEMREVSVGADANFFGSVESVDGKDLLYITTDSGAPNKRVVAVDVNATNLKEGGGAWKEIIPERKDAVLTSVQLAKNMIVAEYEEKAQSRLRLFGMNGEPKGDLRLPGIGSAGISAEHDRTEAFVSFTSFNYPTTIFRVDLAQPNAEPSVWERPDVPVDPSIAEVKQVTYTSKDGTPVTMFIVHKKGLSLDGANPTILTGYGGFNISQTPYFSATMFPWLEAGGILAMPNLRGGGEYGKTWHEDGMRENKQNVFDDFYAAAQYLFDNGYTNPKKLAISGGSNGGLLTGTAVVQKPEMFAAAIVAVPLLDMLRYQNFLMARYWVPEYGSVDEPGDEGTKAARWLKAYSPYQQIKGGVNYPAVMVTAGENDTRVHPMHARKFAAALQAVTGPNAANPVLLWVDRDAGHGAGKPLNLRLRDAVDTRMFLMWRLGMLDEPKK
jgi:prolyl oligopeptidase